MLRVSFETPESSPEALGLCQMSQGDRVHNGTILEKIPEIPDNCSKVSGEPADSPNILYVTSWF